MYVSRSRTKRPCKAKNRVKEGININQLVTGIFYRSADSMAARGYGLKGRTSFVLYKMSLRDILMIGLVIFCGIMSIYFASAGKNEMIFYPVVKMPELTLKGVLSGAWFLVLTFMPVITDVAGEIKWRKSESGI